MNRLTVSMSLAGLVAFAAPLGAQGRGRNTNGVPPGLRPPAGMCRIWIDGVPAGQQPAPTDCASAVRNRPSNGRVIFGDERALPGRGFRGSRGDDDEGGRGEHAERGERDGHESNADDERGNRGRERGGDRGNDDDRGEGRRGGSDLCADRDRDGRCDLPRSTAQYPAQMPEMVGAILVGRGQRTAEVASWGLAGATPRLFDANRDGTPERVHWMSPSGELVQVWSDVNRDGRADRVEIYEAGRRVSTINGPSRP